MGRFSFGKVCFGLMSGITIPFMVHDNVYYAIATCFLSPHLKYRREVKQRNVDRALPVESLDKYFKDIGKSFVFFWLVIGPTLYTTYVKKQNMFEMERLDGMQGLGLGEDDGDREHVSNKRDSFADILKKMKTAKADEAKAEAEENNEKD